LRGDNGDQVFILDRIYWGVKNEKIKNEDLPLNLLGKYQGKPVIKT